MPSLNVVMVIGNLGKDPEMKFTPSGNAVTSFSVAASRTYTVDGERKQETEWFNVVTWNKLAENCNEFLAKGQSVYIEGRQHTRSWGGQDGQKHYRTELIANKVIFLEKRLIVAPDGESSEGEGASIEPSDIPF